MDEENAKKSCKIVTKEKLKINTHNTILNISFSLCT